MKKLNIAGEITLQSVPKGLDQAPKMEVCEMILDCLRTPEGGRGINIAEMSKIIDVIKKVEVAKKTGADNLILENAEHETLMECINKMRFAIIDPAIYNWAQTVKNLPDIQIDEKKEASKKAS